MKKNMKSGRSYRQRRNTPTLGSSDEKKTPAERKKPTRLGAALKEALKGSGIATDLNLFPIWSRWADLVGPAVARHTHPNAIKGTLLLVNVSSAPWLHELQFLKKDMIIKLNGVLGREVIRDIRFQIGPVEAHRG